MKTLAIRGDEERGSEVIALLEMFGGINTDNFRGTDIEDVYFVSDYNDICFIDIDAAFVAGNYVIFTLDEFYEKYPYKVGDKVTLNKYDCKFMVTKVEWTGYAIRYLLFHHAIGNEWWSIEEIKEDNMETKVEGSLIVSEDISKNEKMEIDLNEYDYKVKNGKLIILKKKHIYPKSWEESMVYLNDKGPLCNYKQKLILDFQNLLICRDAYWKMAGEQMRLEKPWEPNWTTFEGMSAIFRFRYNIVCDFVKDQHCLLVFPTEEMRDAFYDNFKDLIERCKDLL